MSVNVAEVFGQDVFNEAVMKERLPEVTYKQMVKLMNEGGEVTLAVSYTHLTLPTTCDV